MFHGNEPSRWKSIPDRPSGAESIGTFVVIEHDGGRFREWMLYTKTGHCGGAYHDALTRLKRLCEEQSEAVEMVDQLTQPARTPSVGGEGQPRQVFQVRLVEFFREGSVQFEGALG